MMWNTIFMFVGHLNILAFFEVPPYFFHSGCTILHSYQQHTRVPVFEIAVRLRLKCVL